VEKAVTLAAAKRLKAAIETRLGIRVILTRDDDRDLGVDDRAAVANNNKADLFLSLHANASPRPDRRGALIYTASFDALGDAAAPPTPERVAVFGGGFRDIEIVPWNVAQIRFLPLSIDAAHILESQMQTRVPLAAPTVSGAPLRVLESANMPALLVEMGYLSNAEQERQLAGTEFQNTFAETVVDAVVAFRASLLASVEGPER
jgi:N-acetylmuramoyl-L-alanine amidase